MLRQDCCLILQPYPFSLEGPSDMSWEDAWHARPGRRGSNVYEVNPWLWQFGHGRPRLGDLSVSETEERRDAVIRAGRRGVSRPAAAARQRGAEMNETYATSTSEGYPGITQFLNTIPNLNWVMQV